MDEQQQQQLMIIGGGVGLLVFIIIIYFMFFTGVSYERMDGFDHPGNDIECLNDPSAEQCKTKCTADKNCKGYITGGWGCCYKHTLGNKAPYNQGPFFTKK
jgi:Na+-transporting methylmalonyl-CoA/oxaloacetate decarboxylase gamma subunit